MRKVALVLVLLFGFVLTEETIAQTCGTAEANSEYWGNFPNKRVFEENGRIYMQVFYYVPGGYDKLRARRIFKWLGCRRGCGVCAAGAVLYDITDGSPVFVDYVVIMPDASPDILPSEATKNKFGEWELIGWQVVPDSEGFLIVPTQQ